MIEVSLEDMFDYPWIKPAALSQIQTTRWSPWTAFQKMELRGLKLEMEDSNPHEDP